MEIATCIIFGLIVFLFLIGNTDEPETLGGFCFLFGLVAGAILYALHWWVFFWMFVGGGVIGLIGWFLWWWFGEEQRNERSRSKLEKKQKKELARIQNEIERERFRQEYETKLLKLNTELEGLQARGIQKLYEEEVSEFDQKLKRRKR